MEAKAKGSGYCGGCTYGKKAQPKDQGPDLKISNKGNSSSAR
jgi:hypothetical protein